ncbi:HD-domain/PDEase-like protein [Hypoxylon rubiginosum]|uniref:HD-domain/PDEase-like protein n=1 Tax=Hypoxylon rubiginosum TaxID=110542 RepID=A0ACC0DEC6_9PEZI|nr:HD-domain/PDEase-like protein [Hypoxylon rubiginosum]
MDSATCNVIYVDRNVHADRSLGSSGPELTESGELGDNLGLLLDAFGNVHVCASGAACISKLFHLHDTSMVELKPTLVLIDTPHNEQVIGSMTHERDHSPCSEVSQSNQVDEYPEGELYGLRLLERIVYETHLRSLSKLVVPIPVISFPLLRTPPANDGANDDPVQPAYADYLSEAPDATSRSLTSRALLRKCMDSGAVDVMASPLHMKTLTTLEVHAYRAHKEAAREQQAALEVRRGRKRSWVGVHEGQPYSYLREAMVSGLMKGICRSSGAEAEDRIGSIKVNVPSDRRSEIAAAVGKWHFCAHDFCDDSLLIAAILMFKHALSAPELSQWRIPTDQLTSFLVATRAAYNTFVPYHNFRHAVDVLQATFNFLVHIGALPPYPSQSSAPTESTQKPPLSALLRPFEALTLLIAAIGHDVGHPGVNNGFLVVLNAPLAQLYNDRSVLESFHCAAYSQILRRYWPSVFQDRKMRTLMISSILATDMGLHFDYMKRLNDLQGKLRAGDSVDGWKPEEQTAFVCSLLIKCADISNVARKYEAALQWMYILCDEFSRQATMENEIGITSSLISPPKKDFLSLAKAQLGFMNMFAIPLFQGVAEVLPAMQYTVDELETNKGLFEKTVEEIPGMDEERRRKLTEGILSPRALSQVAVRPDGMEDFTLDPTKCDLVPNHAEMKKAGSSPPEQPIHIPDVPGQYKEMNGVSIGFDSVADFAASDPFNINETENRVVGHNGKQRCSETTDGSNSVPPGDWQSQATSATTGKMPLSPSTQGTSIVSQESIEPSCSLPVTTVTAPDCQGLATDCCGTASDCRGNQSDCRGMAPTESFESVNSEDDSNGNTLKPEKSLKKKTSRFRMNVTTFFRRNKGASSPSSIGSQS